jgi:hypothetical protein
MTKTRPTYRMVGIPDKWLQPSHGVFPASDAMLTHVYGLGSAAFPDGTKLPKIQLFGHRNLQIGSKLLR